MTFNTKEQFNEQLAKLPKKDRREIRLFQRFLKLEPKWKTEMLKRPFWQKYMGLSPAQAKKILEQGEPK